MRKIILLFCLFPNLLEAQTLFFGLGMSHSTLDWQYKYYQDEPEDMYFATLHSYAFTAGLKYFQKERYSLSSEIIFFRSGGRFNEEEKNTDYKINADEINAYNNLSLGASFNFLPVNKKVIIETSIGPRIDVLLPERNSTLRWIEEYGELNRVNFGLTGSLGVSYQFNKISIGIKEQYLLRIRKLADFEPYFYKVGAVGRDNIFLTTLTLGFKLQQDNLE